MENNKIPVYEVRIDEDHIGMYCISLVDDPATMVSWQAFKEEKMDFSVVDSDEHKVMAVVMRANFDIIRRSPTGEKYFIRFTPENIDIMAQHFLKNGYQGLVNVQHMDNSYIEGVELTQLFIKDSAKGINPKGFETIEEGSLFAIYKIENENVWDAIKKGIFTGLSLEGIFNMVPADNDKPIENPDIFTELWNEIRKQ